MLVKIYTPNSSKDGRVEVPVKCIKLTWSLNLITYKGTFFRRTFNQKKKNKTSLKIHAASKQASIWFMYHRKLTVYTLHNSYMICIIQQHKRDNQLWPEISKAQLTLIVISLFPSMMSVFRRQSSVCCNVCVDTFQMIHTLCVDAKRKSLTIQKKTVCMTF